MQTNGDAWKGLTAAQRAGWTDFGGNFSRTDSLGQTYSLTGFQAYCSVNNNNLAAGNAVVADAPVFSLPYPLVSITLTLTSASFSVAYTVTPLAAGYRAFIFASPQVSAGRNFNGDFRLIAVTAAAAASPANILAAYTARFGAPVTGNRIFVSVQLYQLGMLSTPIAASQVVA